jgi:hypothetical protein
MAKERNDLGLIRKIIKLIRSSNSVFEIQQLRAEAPSDEGKKDLIIEKHALETAAETALTTIATNQRNKIVNVPSKHYSNIREQVVESALSMPQSFINSDKQINRVFENILQQDNLLVSDLAKLHLIATDDIVSSDRPFKSYKKIFNHNHRI